MLLGFACVNDIEKLGCRSTCEHNFLVRLLHICLSLYVFGRTFLFVYRVWLNWLLRDSVYQLFCSLLSPFQGQSVRCYHIVTFIAAVAVVPVLVNQTEVWIDHDHI